MADLTAPAVNGSLSLLEKLRLVAEILRDYVPALYSLRRDSLPEMVRRARDVPRTSVAVDPSVEHDVARRLGRATVRTVGLLPTDSRCLVRSLVVLRLLSRRSIDARLIIGVRPGPGFLAHAWVERDGRPVLPPGEFERLKEL